MLTHGYSDGFSKVSSGYSEGSAAGARQPARTETALKAVALMHRAGVVDVTSRIAMAAVKLGAELRLPMADSLILATAQAFRAILWTQDTDFDGLRGVKFTKK